MFFFFLNFCETISGRKSHEAVISARTGPGPVNDRRGDSQSLSPEITVMAVCLTSTLTSPPPLLLFFFSTSTFSPCDRGWETRSRGCAVFSPGRPGNPKTRGGCEWNSCVSSITGRQRLDCCGGVSDGGEGGDGRVGVLSRDLDVYTVLLTLVHRERQREDSVLTVCSGVSS